MDLGEFALIIGIFKDFFLIILSVVLVMFLIVSYSKFSKILNRLLRVSGSLDKLTTNVSGITELFSKATLENHGISDVVARIYRTIIGKSSTQTKQGDSDEEKQRI